MHRIEDAVCQNSMIEQKTQISMPGQYARIVCQDSMPEEDTDWKTQDSMSEEDTDLYFQNRILLYPQDSIPEQYPKNDIILHSMEDNMI